MQAVILCGGLGTRLRPVTEKIPKALVEVAGRPFLEVQLEELARAGVGEAVLLTGYLGEMVKKRFGSGGGGLPRLRYSRESRPLGTGGALKLAAPLLADRFLLVNGDTFLPADYRGLLRALERFPGGGVLTAFPASGSGRVPNLRLSQEGVVTGYDRRGDPDAGFAYVDAGVGAFHRGLLRVFPPEESFPLEEKAYPALVARARLGALISPEDFYDIGTPARLVRFEKFLSSRRSRQP